MPRDILSDDIPRRYTGDNEAAVGIPTFGRLFSCGVSRCAPTSKLLIWVASGQRPVRTASARLGRA
jgi:hypothetical protein